MLLYWFKEKKIFRLDNCQRNKRNVIAEEVLLRASSVIVLIVYRHRFVNLERDFIIFHDSPLSSSTIYFMLILTSHYSGPCSDYLFAEPYFQWWVIHFATTFLFTHCIFNIVFVSLRFKRKVNFHFRQETSRWKTQKPISFFFFLPLFFLMDILWHHNQYKKNITEDIRHGHWRYY